MQEMLPAKKDVLVLRALADDPPRLERIGTLKEKRAKDGELLAMDLSPIPTEWDTLQGDNVLYFRKKENGLYLWIDFETYAYNCEDWADSVWPDNFCETIDLGADSPPPGRERGKLQRVLEDAERTIQLIRQGKPIQSQTRTSETKDWNVRNEVRPQRRNNLRQAFSPPQKLVARADCDILVKTAAAKKLLSTLGAQARRPALDLLLTPARGGMRVELVKALSSEPLLLKGNGRWTRRITVSVFPFMSTLEKENSRSLRLTYLAGRLFMNQLSLPAKEEPIPQPEHEKRPAVPLR